MVTALRKLLNDLPAETRAEIVCGQLIVQPPPAVRHNWVVQKLLVQLSLRFGDGDAGGGAWIILQDPGLNIPAALWSSDEPEFVEPDLAGWRTSRMPEVPDVTFIDLTPDWLCEVLSGNEKHDRETKLPLYARMGVPHLWLVDPRKLTLEVYALRDERYARVHVAQGSDTVHAAPFEDYALELSSLWLKRPALK
jgi:Uma2 family endonuclease